MLLFSHQLIFAEPTVQHPVNKGGFVPPTLNVDGLENYFERWHWLTGYDLSGLHWHNFISIYTNIGTKVYRNNYFAYIEQLANDMEDEEQQSFLVYPVKTILIKENYNKRDKKPDQPLFLTIMVKREKGYDPDNGDWEYIKSNVDGDILVQGNSQDKEVYEQCASCHINISDRDYIFSTIYNAGH